MPPDHTACITLATRYPNHTLYYFTVGVDRLTYSQS